MSNSIEPGMHPGGGRHKGAYEQVSAYGAYPGVPAYYGSGGGLDVKRSFNQFVQIVLRGKWIIAAGLILTLGAVAALTFMMEPEYRASTLMMVDTGKANDGLEALNYGFVEAAGTDASRTTQAMILQQSIQIAQRTYERLVEAGTVPGTNRPFTFVDARDELVKSLNGAEPTAQDWADYLQNNYIRVATEGDASSGAIRVFGVSSDPVEAAALANAYAEEYRVYSVESSLERIRQSRAFLEDQISKTTLELDDIESRITQYQRREGAIALDASSQLTVAQLADLQQQLSEALVERRMLETSLGAMEDQLSQIEPRLAANVSAGLDEEMVKVREKIANLEAILEPIYRKNPELKQDPSSEPHVLEIVTQLNGYKADLARLSQQYVEGTISPGGDPTATGGEGLEYATGLKNQITQERIRATSLDSKIDELRRTISRQTATLDQLPAKSVQLQQMERVRLATESKLLDLQKNLREARIAEESRVGFVKVIRPALVPTSPEKPDRPRNLMLGAILGLMLGLGGAIVRASMDSRLYTPDDITSRGMTLMGAVPDMSATIESDFAGKATHEAKGKQVSTSIGTLLNPSSPIAEAYRRLYVNIQFSVPDKVVQTILVSSPEAEVGKSTTSLNLAVTAARARRRTLIIDADFHRPSVARYLGLKKTADIRQLVSRFSRTENGNGAKGASFDVSSLETGFDNLYALAPTEPIPDHAEMLGSYDFRQLLHQMRELFDVIVIDTPPVLLTADAATISTQADAVVLVAGAGTTDGAALDHCVQELRHVGANVLGAVINRFDPSRETGYKHTYKYRYQEYNKYYRGGKKENLAKA